MLAGMTCKTVLVNTDFTVDDGAFTTAEIDTLGYDYAVIDILTGNVPADVATCKITESDTPGSGHADISGATATIPATGGGGKVYGFALDLRSRKRYLDVVLTAGNGLGTPTEAAIVCKLYRGHETPVTDAELGYNGSLVRLP
jgi:hypothetical protein